MNQKLNVIIILTVLPKPVYAWDLKIGERFCLNESGFNTELKRHEIYLKVSKTKCVLDSHPDKLVFSIPKLCKSMKAIAYKLIEEFEVEKNG